MPSFSSATWEMRLSFAACAISMSDGIARDLSRGWYGLSGSVVQQRERLALAVARVARPFAALGHLDGAVLELGDLAERVERRVGEQVRRRLVERERDEHGAARRAFVGARVERNAAAARGDRHHVAGLRLQGGEVERMERGDRLGLDG